MKNRRVKMKGLFCAILILAILPLSLYGCGKTEQGQKTESEVELHETAKTETESDRKPDVEPEESQAIIFPENFSDTIGNVTFNMDIIVNADLTEASIVTAKAQIQKVNRKKAFQLFFGNIDTYDTYDYEEEDEYGKPAQQITYVSPEETTLAYGPESSKFDYMKRALMPYVLNAFVPFQDQRYNADLYSTEVQLTFMTREEAFKTVQNTLQAIDLNLETAYTAYALDHETMQSQEYHEDIDGNMDSSQYKTQWSGTDDCYYFYINQTYKGLPLYYIHNKAFEDAADIDALIQAVVSGEGIEWLNIEKVFEFSEEKGGISLADIDFVVKIVADKYNQIPGDTTYEITKAELHYYIDLSSGMGTYDVKPIWILTGSEKGGKNIQIIIDAQSAEEIPS